MKFFKLKLSPTHYLSPEDETDLVKASRRVARLRNEELLDWADQAGTGMATLLYEHRKHGDVGSIAEVKEAMVSLQAVVYELHLRAVARHESMRE